MASETAMLLVVSIEQQHVPFQYARSGQSPSEEASLFAWDITATLQTSLGWPPFDPEKWATRGQGLDLRPPKLPGFA
jgi:hypothetical protein